MLFKEIDYTDYTVVRNLIFNRKEIESISRYQQEVKFLSHEMSNYNIETAEYIANIYAVLDNYIKICQFNQENTEIINYMFSGMDVQDICKKKNVGSQLIFNRLRRIVSKINLIARLERG